MSGVAGRAVAVEVVDQRVGGDDAGWASRSASSARSAGPLTATSLPSSGHAAVVPRIPNRTRTFCPYRRRGMLRLLGERLVERCSVGPHGSSTVPVRQNGVDVSSAGDGVGV